MKEIVLDRPSFSMGKFDDLEIGDAFRIAQIRQDLPPERYDPRRVRSYLWTVDRYERISGKKLRVSVPEEKGRRSVLIRRIK